MSQSFSEVDIVRKGLATMAEQDSSPDDGVVAIPTVANRAPYNSPTNGWFTVTVDDSVTGGTFSLILNGEETEAIVWDPDPDVLGSNILGALNDLAVTQGHPLDFD